MLLFLVQVSFLFVLLVIYTRGYGKFLYGKNCLGSCTVEIRLSELKLSGLPVFLDKVFLGALFFKTNF